MISMQPNKSKISGTIEELIGYEEGWHLPAIKMKVETSEDINREPNYTTCLVGQTTIIRMQKEDYVNLKQGERIMITVAARGGPNICHYFGFEPRTL